MIPTDPNGRGAPTWAADPRLTSCLAGLLILAAGCATAPAVPVSPPAAPESAVAEPAVAAPAATADPERFAGLWVGAIIYQPGSAELEATVELATDPEGKLVGTLDMAAFDMLYHPLEDLRIEGSEVFFSYRRDSEVRGPNALFAFEGHVDEDGDLVGEFLESRGRIPFRFERAGDPGTPRPELQQRPLADLSPDGHELEQVFNEDEDKARLVLLLSPT